jgi:hypothetical protein
MAGSPVFYWVMAACAASEIQRTAYLLDGPYRHMSLAVRHVTAGAERPALFAKMSRHGNHCKSLLFFIHVLSKFAYTLRHYSKHDSHGM